MSTITHRGRTYRVLAHFEGEGAEDKASEYLRTHLHVRLLFETPTESVIISDRDFGVPADAPDSEFGTKGWTSLYTSTVTRAR